MKDFSLTVGGVPVIENLSLEIFKKDILWVRGPNGAGKTSFLHALMGLTRCKGHVELQEFDYLGHQNALWPELTAAQNIAILRNDFDIQKYANWPVAHLSAGYQKRVALTRLLQSGKPLWILDEPFVNLDMTGEGILHKILENHLQNGAVVMTSHQEKTFSKSIKIRELWL